MNRSSKPLRVLRLIAGIGECSAAYNQFTLSWTDRVQTTICTFYKPSLVVPSNISIFPGDGSLKGFFRALRQALNAKEYDIVHVHSSHMGTLFLMGALLFRRDLLAKTVCGVHNTWPRFETRHKLMFMLIFSVFRRIVCCSSSSFRSVPRLFRWLAGDRLRCIPNGADVIRIDTARKNMPSFPVNSSFTIVVIGRLVDVKKHLDVLKAFRRCSAQEKKLTFIGEGLLRDQLNSQITGSRLEDSVTITGVIPREKVYEYLARADLFVSASSVEGLPLAVLEAMISSCPVILSDIPSHREIADGVDFIPLVKVGDIAGFTREIDRFQSMSSEQRTAIGKKCRKLAVEQFSLKKMHEKYEEIYLQLIE